jgi:predicted permease
MILAAMPIDLNQLAGIYAPLIGWTVAGLLFLRFVPDVVPRLMGRSLYWVGVPVQILAFTLRTELDRSLWLVPAVVVAALIVSVALGWGFAWRLPSDEKASFLIAAAIGNTGFVGLAIAPSLISDAYLGWVILFAVAHNIIGSYGFGVAIASIYGKQDERKSWLGHLRSVLKTPSIWTFALGLYLQINQIELIKPIDDGLQLGAQVVIPIALILIGIRFRQIKHWQGFWQALPAVAIKLVLMPLLVGAGATWLGLIGMPRLALVIMAGMPTAFAGVILAEEYNFNSSLLVLSIVISSVGVLFTIPLWLLIF